MTEMLKQKTERLDKILSNGGFGSRKDVKKLLHSLRVTVNGTAATNPSMHVCPGSDVICVDGKPVELNRHVYLMLNKCKNVVSANKDGEHQTVFDLLPDEYRAGKVFQELHTVGRLDIDTEGLLLLTTDGALTHVLISPKSHISKTYLVFLENPETSGAKEEICRKFEAGIHIPAEDNDGEADCKGAELTFISSELAEKLAGPGAELPQLWQNGDFCLLVIYEGRYHQVKRMFRAVGNKVVYLKRMAMGRLELDSSLLPGQMRPLSSSEIEILKF